MWSRSLLVITIFLWALSPAIAAAKRPPKEIAVLFNGPTICEGCGDNIASDLRRRHYKVIKVGAGQTTPQLLAKASVYVVPGGEDVQDSNEGWSRAERQALRDFVQNGGSYIGFCLGAAWAADWPGEKKGVHYNSLDIVPALAQPESPPLDLSQKAIDAAKKARVETVNWQGHRRQTYFQDGPGFTMDPGTDAKVLASYKDDHVATFVSHYGAGTVAVTGVHIEADASWFEGDNLRPPKKNTKDLMKQFMDEALARPPKATAASLPSRSRFASSPNQTYTRPRIRPQAL